MKVQVIDQMGVNNRFLTNSSKKQILRRSESKIVQEILGGSKSTLCMLVNGKTKSSRHN